MQIDATRIYGVHSLPLFNDDADADCASGDSSSSAHAVLRCPPSASPAVCFIARRNGGTPPRLAIPQVEPARPSAHPGGAKFGRDGSRRGPRASEPSCLLTAMRMYRPPALYLRSPSCSPLHIAPPLSHEGLGMRRWSDLPTQIQFGKWVLGR